jgi:hypothetical protein
MKRTPLDACEITCPVHMVEPAEARLLVARRPELKPVVVDKAAVPLSQHQADTLLVGKRYSTPRHSVLDAHLSMQFCMSVGRNASMSLPRRSESGQTRKVPLLSVDVSVVGLLHKKLVSTACAGGGTAVDVVVDVDDVVVGFVVVVAILVVVDNELVVIVKDVVNEEVVPDRVVLDEVLLKEVVLKSVAVVVRDSIDVVVVEGVTDVIVNGELVTIVDDDIVELIALVSGDFIDVAVEDAAIVLDVGAVDGELSCKDQTDSEVVDEEAAVR